MNRSNRFSKLMGSMGLGKPEEQARPTGQRKAMSQEDFEAVSGTEHPELQKQRRLQSMITAKIAELEASDDPNSIESLNFWRQKLKEVE